MNILFTGPYRCNDGWGGASKDYLKALLRTKHNIVCRPIFLAWSLEQNLLPEFIDVEKKTFDTRPDVIIQNVLPNFLDYQYGMKNIALCYFETKGLQHTTWITNLNLMDEVWVSSTVEKNNLISDGVYKPIQVIPMPINLNDNFGTKKWKVESIDDSSFLFYDISEYNDRKNIYALLLAFYREFKYTDNTKLLIKLHKTGCVEESLFKTVNNDIRNFKKALRMFTNDWGYEPVIFIVKRLTNEEIHSIHVRGDCLVQPSRGESLCRPVIDALYVGNRVIATKHTGMDDVVQGDGCWNARSHATPAFTKNPPLPYLYTSRETWQEVDILDLQKCMREAYNSWKENPEKLNRKSQIGNRHSYDSVARKIELILGKE